MTSNIKEKKELEVIPEDVVDCLDKSEESINAHLSNNITVCPSEINVGIAMNTINNTMPIFTEDPKHPLIKVDCCKEDQENETAKKPKTLSLNNLSEQRQPIGNSYYYEDHGSYDHYYSNVNSSDEEYTGPVGVDYGYGPMGYGWDENNCPDEDKWEYYKY